MEVLHRVLKDIEVGEDQQTEPDSEVVHIVLPFGLEDLSSLLESLFGQLIPELVRLLLLVYLTHFYLLIGLNIMQCSRISQARIVGALKEQSDYF